MCLLLELVHDHKGAYEAYQCLLLIVFSDTHRSQDHGDLSCNLLLTAIFEAAVAVLLEDVVDSLNLFSTMRVKHVLPLPLVKAYLGQASRRLSLCSSRTRLALHLLELALLEWVVFRWLNTARRLRISHIVMIVAVVIVSKIEEVVVSVLFDLRLLSGSISEQLVHINLLVAVLVEHRLIPIRLVHLLSVVHLELAHFFLLGLLRRRALRFVARLLLKQPIDVRLVLLVLAEIFLKLELATLFVFLLRLLPALALQLDTLLIFFADEDFDFVFARTLLLLSGALWTHASHEALLFFGWYFHL